MNYAIIHKLLGLTFIVGVFLALASESDAAQRTRSPSGSYMVGSGKCGVFHGFTTSGRSAGVTKFDGFTETPAQLSRS